MSDAPKPSQSLSEISHLFLSSIRERQTAGAPKPQRIPPGQRPAMREPEVDLTAEEVAHVSAEPELNEQTQIAPCSAIVTGYLNGSVLDRARQYAAHLCTRAGRVGLILLDACEFRVLLFEHNPHADQISAQEPMTQGFDARRMSEALEELAWDVDRWLVLMPNLRSPEARTMLRQLPHWALLTTCDHDGVVAGYRTLKGLAELGTPATSLALLDAPGQTESQKAFRKLRGVTQQFLNWEITADESVTPVDHVAEHLVIGFCGAHDKAQLATAPQWDIVQRFVSRARKMETEAVMEETVAPSLPQPPRHVADIRIEEKVALHAAPVVDISEPAMSIPIAAPLPMKPASGGEPEVYDLPNGDTSPVGITGAVLQSRSGELIECPVKPPMCPDARLAVRRDKRLVLVAVAKQGLSDLRAIGQAFQWMLQNRPLLCMAMPQLTIDAHQSPQLELIVDHHDMSADILQPMLESGNVTVHAYRKLRWGAKTGLLLDAA
jgi:hypothetical protein